MDSQNLNLYHIFYETASYGNISQAAKRLFISQPAVSKSISKLEDNLHTILFSRSSRGVRLTYEGELLYKQLDTAFRAIRQGEEQLRLNGENNAGELLIGVSNTLCKYVLLPYLKEYINSNPYVKVTISCQSTYETITSLEQDSIDVGLVGETKRIGNLDFYPVKEIHDVFVATREYWDLLNEKASLHGTGYPNHITNDILSNATLLLLDKNNVTRRYVDRYLLSENIHADSVIEVSSMDLLIEFAKIGLGIACVIEDFVGEELASGALVRLPIEHAIAPRKIGLACKKHENPTKPFLNFINNLHHLVD